MKQIVSAALLVILVLSFSSCSRYISWGKEVFNQGDKLDTFSRNVKPYIRANRIYDQFTTLGNFDALWLADPVRKSYAQAHALKNCYSKEQYIQFLREQLEQNDHFISFYLLAIVGGPGVVELTDKNAVWSVQLNIDGECFSPVKIEVVDQLPPEYQYFFGRHWTVFKDQYLISFNAIDEDNNPLLYHSLSSLSLVFRRMGHQVELVWPLDGQSHVIPRCTLDSDVLAYDLYDNI